MKGLLALLHGPPGDLHQRPEALAQCLESVAVAAVSQLRRGADGVGQLPVIWLPPHVPGPAWLPGELLDVDALVEPELRVRAAEPGILDAAPCALAGAVRE